MKWYNHPTGIGRLERRSAKRRFWAARHTRVPGFVTPRVKLCDIWPPCPYRELPTTTYTTCSIIWCILRVECNPQLVYSRLFANIYSNTPIGSDSYFSIFASERPGLTWQDEPMALVADPPNLPHAGMSASTTEKFIGSLIKHWTTQIIGTRVPPPEIYWTNLSCMGCSVGRHFKCGYEHRLLVWSSVSTYNYHRLFFFSSLQRASPFLFIYCWNVSWLLFCLLNFKLSPWLLFYCY